MRTLLTLLVVAKLAGMKTWSDVEDRDASVRAAALRAADSAADKAARAPKPEEVQKAIDDFCQTMKRLVMP